MFGDWGQASEETYSNGAVSPFIHQKYIFLSVKTQTKKKTQTVFYFKLFYWCSKSKPKCLGLQMPRTEMDWILKN